MIRKTVLLFVFASLLCGLLSCSKERIPTPSDKSNLLREWRTRVGEPDSLHIPRLGRKLNNPYQLRNMQLACDSICKLRNLPTIVLVPTDLYVRFLPTDSTEFNALQALGTELFNFPLDYEILGDATEYRDSSLLESQMTWQYTTIPIGITLPDVEHEVLDTCYIPQLESTLEPLSQGAVMQSILPSNNSFESDLELLACEIANPGYELTENGFVMGNVINSFSSYPSGSVRVKKSSSVSEPVKKVKVKVWYFVKTSSAYTNDNGVYCITTSYNKNPHYSVVFDNQIGFDVRGSIISLSTDSKNFGRQSKAGYNMVFNLTDDKWYAAVLNNCVYDYFKKCQIDQRKAPPSDLRIVGLNNGGSQGSGAPMCKHIGNLSGLFSANEIISLLCQVPSPTLTSLVLGVMKYLLPDIVIETDSNDYDTIAQSVYHEMSHASHFAMAGTTQWLKIMAGTARYSIPVNRMYGDGLDNDAIQDFLELGESWAFANERVFLNDPELNKDESWFWFDPAVTAIYNIIDKSILTEKQFLSCMPAIVSSIDDLYLRLRNTYSSKAHKIGYLFSSEESLRYQSHWILHNESSQTVSVVVRSVGFERTEIVAANDSLLLTAIPDSTSNCGSLYSFYSAFRPDRVKISLLSGETVYEENNDSIIVPLDRPFWGANEWSFTTIHRAPGNGDTYKFTFSLTDSDL